MKLFNKYYIKEKFRWLGVKNKKYTFAIGFSFGKPIWYIPYLELVLNDKRPPRVNASPSL